MNIAVRVVAFCDAIGIQKAHGREAIGLKFIVIQEGEDVVVVMGYTSQHRALALVHAYQYDFDRLRAFYARDWEFEPHYRDEIQHLVIIGGGWASPRWRMGKRVPAEDLVIEWESRSLRAVTPLYLRPELERAILASCDAAIDEDRAANPPPADEDF